MLEQSTDCFHKETCRKYVDSAQWKYLRCLVMMVSKQHQLYVVMPHNCSQRQTVGWICSSEIQYACGTHELWIQSLEPKQEKKIKNSV